MKNQEEEPPGQDLVFRAPGELSLFISEEGFLFANVLFVGFDAQDHDRGQSFDGLAAWHLPQLALAEPLGRQRES